MFLSPKLFYILRAIFSSLSTKSPREIHKKIVQVSRVSLSLKYVKIAQLLIFGYVKFSWVSFFENFEIEPKQLCKKLCCFTCVNAV